ncbi:hypothetical protein DFH27DRAFT_656807 [Peziza echinospora]|nr:hypothetical protein DFH27DRAFT_656807 [Peziza echinospora]
MTTSFTLPTTAPPGAAPPKATISIPSILRRLNLTPDSTTHTQLLHKLDALPDSALMIDGHTDLRDIWQRNVYAANMAAWAANDGVCELLGVGEADEGKKEMQRRWYLFRYLIVYRAQRLKVPRDRRGRGRVGRGRERGGLGEGGEGAGAGEEKKEDDGEEDGVTSNEGMQPAHDKDNDSEVKGGGEGGAEEHNPNNDDGDETEEEEGGGNDNENSDPGKSPGEGTAEGPRDHDNDAPTLPITHATPIAPGDGNRPDDFDEDRFNRLRMWQELARQQLEINDLRYKLLEMEELRRRLAVLEEGPTVRAKRRRL